VASLFESEPELEVSLLGEEEEELLPLFVLFEEPLPLLMEVLELVSLLLPSLALLVPQQEHPLLRLSVLLTQVIFVLEFC